MSTAGRIARRAPPPETPPSKLSRGVAHCAKGHKRDVIWWPEAVGGAFYRERGAGYRTVCKPKTCSTCGGAWVSVKDEGSA